MSQRSRTLSVVVGTPIALLAMAAPAFAASNYDFTANFKYRLNSASSWSQGAGSDTWFFHCTAGSGQQYSVKLYQDHWYGDSDKGSKTFTCNGTDDTATWSSLDSGNYHFTMTKSDNGVYIVGSGHVGHP